MLALPVFEASEIKPLLSIQALIEPMRQAFIDLSEGKVQAPIAVLHPTDKSDIHVKSAVIENAPYFTVKMAGWSEVLADQGLPASSGMIAIFDSTTCKPLAILRDDHVISDFRTAAAGAVAIDLLARPNAKSVLIIGTGTQAYLQAQAVLTVRDITEVLLWGRNAEKVLRLREKLLHNHPDLSIRPCTDLENAVRQVDIVVTATAAKKPVLQGEWLVPGQHIMSVGADDTTKQELDINCFRRANVVAVDAVDAARIYGNLHNSGYLTECGEGSIAELGQIISQECDGRKSVDDITIASLVGLGVQDLATVAAISGKLGF